jgi:hypothetical protein
MVTRLLQKEGTIYTESLLHTCSRKCPLSYPKKESSHSDSRALALSEAEVQLMHICSDQEQVLFHQEQNI